MQGRGQISGARRRIAGAIAIAAAAGLLAAVPVAASAAGNAATAVKRETVRLSAPDRSATVAKKKGKSKSPTTKTATAPFASGTAAAATASCTGKSHATGGGFSVTPPFVPDPASINGTGLRNVGVASIPSGSKGWLGSSAALTSPVASGAINAFARCEPNTLGQIVVRASSSATLVPGEARTLNFVCPSDTHVISGGYSTDPPLVFNNINGWRVTILQNQRTAKAQWSVTGFNRSAGAPANSPSTLTGYAVCEKNGKGQSISESSASAPVLDNQRSVADPSCGGKKHSVAGGFVISPLPAGLGAGIPVVFVDESQPSGKKGWHFGLHEWSNANPPPDQKSLIGIVYCKKDESSSKKK
jgi:hypothetical protein